jgi:hypothetical protein
MDGKPAKLTIHHLLTHTSGMGEITLVGEVVAVADKLRALAPRSLEQGCCDQREDAMAHQRFPAECRNWRTGATILE